jgi:hypothetical protein
MTIFSGCYNVKILVVTVSSNKSKWPDLNDEAHGGFNTLPTTSTPIMLVD